MNAAQAHDLGAGATNGTQDMAEARPALRVDHKPNAALDTKKQAEAVQWQPLAIGLALKWLKRYPSLRHLQEEVEAEALLALCHAARVWDGKRPLYNLLYAYVPTYLRAWLQYQAHTVRVPVSAWRRGERPGRMERLDSPMPGTDMPRAALLVDEDATPLDASLEARDVRRQLEGARAHVLARWLGMCRRAEDAHRRTEAWWRYESDAWGADNPEGVTLQELGEGLGVSRERVRQYMAQSRAFAAEWAREEVASWR